MPALVGVVLGVSGLAGYQKLNAATPAGPILAADRSTAQPIKIMVESLDPVMTEIADLKVKIDKLTTLAEERLPAAKAPPAKRTKTAKVLK